MYTFVRFDRQQNPMALTACPTSRRSGTYETKPSPERPPARRGRPSLNSRTLPPSILPVSVIDLTGDEDEDEDENPPSRAGGWRAVNVPNASPWNTPLPTSTPHPPTPPSIPNPPLRQTTSSISRELMTVDAVRLPSFQAFVSGYIKKRKRDDDEQDDESLVLPPLRRTSPLNSPFTSPSSSRRISIASTPNRSQNVNSSGSAAWSTSTSPSGHFVRSIPATNDGRVCSYRNSPSKDFKALWDQAHSQRFYVICRKRGGTSDWPEEIIEVADTAGKVFKIRINEVPSCDCPKSQFENHCKHLIYVLSKVLHAPYELIYQIALVGPELREIFINAPPIGPSVSLKCESARRKDIQGECPICFDDLRSDGSEELVWCRQSCGQNFHKACFDSWEKARGGDTCPLCRGGWTKDDAVGQKNVADKSDTNSAYHGETWLYRYCRDLEDDSRWYFGSYDEREDVEASWPHMYLPGLQR